MSDDRIIDVVPTTPNEDGCRSDAGCDSDDVCEEDGKVRTDDGRGEAESDVPGTIDDFCAAWKSFYHVEAPRCAYSCGDKVLPHTDRRLRESVECFT